MIGQQNLATFKGNRNPYLVQKIQTASKEKLILMLFEFGSQSCANQNRDKASRVLTELIAALDFEQEKMALSFFEIYRYALDQVQQNHFAVAGGIFSDLAEIWKTHVLKN